MKKVWVAVLMCALVAMPVMAQTNSVTSANVVGYYKLNVPPSGGMVLGALNLDKMGGGNESTLKDVFGTNQLQQSGFPAAADRVYLWDVANTEWDQYFQKTDGEFYNTENPGGASTNPVVAVGQAFFVQSYASGSDTNELTIMGEVVAVNTQLVDIVGGGTLQTVGYPFSAEIQLQDATLTQDGSASDFPAAADRVYVFDPSEGYIQYYLKGDRQWYKTADQSGPYNPTISVGQGFWYQGASAFTWTETNTYIGNL